MQRTYFFDCLTTVNSSVNIGKRAVKGNKRPDADIPLCHLPTMNIWKDDRVCTGTVQLLDSTMVDSITAMEKSFLDSHFTHPNHELIMTEKPAIQPVSVEFARRRLAGYLSLRQWRGGAVDERTIN